MTDSYRATPDQRWSGSNGHQSSHNQNPSPENHDESASGEVGKALLVGLLGGLVSAAGYLVYRRLPEEQKERLHEQVRGAVQQRITEIRQNFNI